MHWQVPRGAAFVAVWLVAVVLTHCQACWPAETPGGTSPTKPVADESPPAEVLPAAAAVSWFQQLDFEAWWRENTWQDWARLAAAVFAGILLGRLAAMMVQAVGQRLAQRGWHARAYFLESSGAPINVVSMTVGLGIGLAGVKMSQPVQVFCQKTFVTLYTLAVVWYAWNLVGLLDIVVARLTHRPQSVVERQLVPILRKTVRLLLVVLAALFLLESVFHQNIGAWLAGLGIAGLAVSLAAQDSLKNLFGSLTILFDRPFCVGDRIATSGYEGVVEEIGFRSTRIRTPNDTVVTIPNANIVNSPVENIARRRFIRRAWSISLPGDSSAEQLSQAIAVVRGILEEPGIGEPLNAVIDGKQLSPLVYCSDLNPGQAVISIVYCYAPADFAAYAEHADRVNRRVVAALQQARIPFNPLLLVYRSA